MIVEIVAEAAQFPEKEYINCLCSVDWRAGKVKSGCRTGPPGLGIDSWAP
jgi:hypothetical protein